MISFCTKGIMLVSVLCERSVFLFYSIFTSAHQSKIKSFRLIYMFCIRNYKQTLIYFLANSMYSFYTITTQIITFKNVSWFYRLRFVHKNGLMLSIFYSVILHLCISFVSFVIDPSDLNIPF